MLEWMIALAALCGAVAVIGVLYLAASLAFGMRSRRAARDFPHARVLQRGATHYDCRDDRSVARRGDCRARDARGVRRRAVAADA